MSERFYHSHILLLLVCIDDIDSLQAFSTLADHNFARPENRMVKPFHRDLKDIVSGIVSNAKKRHGPGLRPVAKCKPFNFHDRSLALQGLRYFIKISLPLGRWKFSDCVHAVLASELVCLAIGAGY